MLDKIRKTKNEIEFPLWTGEFGWEVMTWIPYCRKQSHGFERVIVNCPKSTWPLYGDFATTTISAAEPDRGLKYPKMYRVDGEFRRYGTPDNEYDVLIHARGIRRKVNINYLHWSELVESLPSLRIACVGTEADHLINGCEDLRGIDIAYICDYMAGCRCVVGSSSGVMHLSALCGASLVAWGDRRTYFGETLEKRYCKTWNPFDCPVEWIDADDWQPSPAEINDRILKLL